MKINPIGATYNFKGGKVIAKLELSDSKTYELDSSDFETFDKDRSKRYSIGKNSILRLLNVYDREKSLFSSNIIAAVIGDKKDIQHLIEFLKNTPGDKNILDLTYGKPILKLENEDKAYFVKPRYSINGSSPVLFERSEAIGWHYDA